MRVGDDLVFGMGTTPIVEPDWPSLTLREINEVLASARRTAAEAVDITWHSPRPLSSTCEARMADGTTVVVKRMPVALRDDDALAEEHSFMDHLRAQGMPIPVVWSRTSGEFSYEFQEPGAGTDAYRRAFSWSPYRSRAHAETAGRMLARMHLAARGFDTPARPTRPLLAALCIDPIAAIEQHAAARPAVAEFLSARDWRADLGPAAQTVEASDLEPLWTHNDWHGTNLLWSGDEITSVFDFGLANRTAAVFDLAIAIERFAVDWIALRDGGPAPLHADQLAALLRGYCEVRPLTSSERAILPDIFPLAHVHYELSEIDYFLSVLPDPNPGNAEIAYSSYLIGHLCWVKTSGGRAFLELLGRLASMRQPGDSGHSTDC